MDDEFPPNLMFSLHDVPGVIRLTTASVLLAFENELDGLPSIEAEDMPLSKLKTHAFCNAPLSGNLLRRKETYLKALADSIEQKDLKPVSLRRSLKGELDLARTWLLVDDFHDWCDARDIQLGDWFSQYADDETSIFNAAGDAGDSARRQMEDSPREKRIYERAVSMSGDTEEQVAGVVAIIRENERLRAELHSRREREDKPLAPRERTTLLNVVGALLQLSGVKESAIIDAVLTQHPEVPGLRERTLQKTFAEAKRSLASR